MSKNSQKLISKMLVIFMLVTLLSAMSIGGVVSGVGENLLLNPGFETFANGAFGNWTKSGCDVAQVEGRTGGFAASLTNKASPWSALIQDVAITGTVARTKTFEISAYVKKGGGTGAEAAKIVFEGRTSSFGKTTPNIAFESAAQTITNDAWTKITLTLDGSKIDAGAATQMAMMRVYVSATNKEPIIIDDFELKDVTPPPFSPPAYGVNLIQNSSFETYANNTFANWSSSGFTATQVDGGRTGKAISLTSREQYYSAPNQVFDFPGSVAKDYLFELSAYIKAGPNVTTSEKGIIYFEPRKSDGGYTSPTIQLSAKAYITNSDWTLIKLTIDPRTFNADALSQMAKMRVFFGTDTTKPDILIDDVVLKAIPDPNPIINPGFETGAWGSWSTYPVANNWTISSTETHSGTYAAKSEKVNDPWSQLAQTDLSVRPGKWYDFSFYAKLGGGGSVRVRNNVDGLTVTGSPTISFVANNKWTKYTIEFQAPAEGKVKLAIQESGVGVNYFDDFEIKQIDAPTTIPAIITLKEASINNVDFAQSVNIPVVGDTAVKVNFRNTTGTAVDAVAIVACYENDTLLSVEPSDPIVIPTYSTVTIPLNINIPSGITNGVFKVFVFNSFTNIKPFAPAIHKTIVPVYN